MSTIAISLPDGKTKELPQGATLKTLAEAIGPRLAAAAVAGKVNGKAVDLGHALAAGDTAEIITNTSPEGLEIIRHSTSHLMAWAVKTLKPDVKVTIGPSVEDGFYYDFDAPTALTEEDLPAIEAKMRELASGKKPFVRTEMASADAVALFEGKGENFKAEIIRDINQPTVSLYQVGDFLDLCRGPHVPDTGHLKAFKLLQTAGAYWRGDERNKMLTRVYGTAFAGQKELDEHLTRIEEAKKRDHRRLGRELDLFSFHEEAGAGLCYWHPKGTKVRHLIEEFWRRRHEEGGYDMVVSPHIGKSTLWETSGHLGFYKDSMYAPMEIDGQDYYLKPMNCPFHIMIYKTRQHSYRELPIRYAEMGTVYRYERSGVLHGLMRVRGFTQDDAHIFMREDQVTDEILRVVDFVLFILKTFGFKEFQIFVSTRPSEYVGEPAVWDKATAALKEALSRAGLPFEVDEGGGAFYGPKIDIKIKDSIGRTWQCSTIQVDFNLPERFDMTYIGEDSQKKRLVMIHRALLGSIERFFGILVEHYGGAFPLWLAPTQVRVLTITNRVDEKAAALVARLRQAGLRVELDDGNEKIGAKIRAAQMDKIPYMLVLGDKEAASGQVAVRHRSHGDIGVMEVEAFLAKAKEEIETKQ